MAACSSPSEKRSPSPETDAALPPDASDTASSGDAGRQASGGDAGRRSAAGDAASSVEGDAAPPVDASHPPTDGSDAGPPGGTLLAETTWEGPVVLIESMAGAADGTFLSLRIDGEAALGGKVVTPPAGQQATIAKLDTRLDAQWVRVLERGTGSVSLVRVAAMQDGGVAFAASLPSGTTANVGGDDLTTTATSASFVLAALHPNGDHHWSRAATCSDYCAASAVAAAPNGDLAVGGFLRGSLEMDGRTIDSGASSRLAWVGVFSPDGTARWLKAFAPGGNIPGLSFDASGHLAALGYFSETTTVDGLTLTAGASDTGLLLGLDAESGEAVWKKTFGGDRPTYVYTIGGNTTQVLVPVPASVPDAGPGAYDPNDGVDLTALSTADGSLAWKQPISTAVVGDLGASGRAVVAGSHAGSALSIAGTSPGTAGNGFAAGLGTTGELEWLSDLQGAKAAPYIALAATGASTVTIARAMPSGDAGALSVSLASVAMGP